MCPSSDFTLFDLRQDRDYEILPATFVLFLVDYFHSFFFVLCTYLSYGVLCVGNFLPQPHFARLTVISCCAHPYFPPYYQQRFSLSPCWILNPPPRIYTSSFSFTRSLWRFREPAACSAGFQNDFFSSLPHHVARYKPGG